MFSLIALEVIDVLDALGFVICMGLTQTHLNFCCYLKIKRSMLFGYCVGIGLVRFDDGHIHKKSPCPPNLIGSCVLENVGQLTSLMTTFNISF
jgi:hypothetical protein